jgi:phosphohistidine phosphatase SixA
MITRRLIIALLLLTVAGPAAAQQTIFIVRHAERADGGAGVSPTMDADPDLSEAGQARAASLATVLKDAGITAIFATDRKRTQQTAAPLAKVLGLPVITLKTTDTAGLLAQLKAAKGHALVVGHSNTIPTIVKALGIASPVTVADDEFDKMFVVTASSGSPSILTLHYR